MGVQTVSLAQSKEQMQDFVRHLLRDVKALEYMLEHDMFERDVTRIGAEQEMCLVNNFWKPSPISIPVVDQLKDYAWLDTELAKFNLETNLNPREFSGSALRDMEQELREYLHLIQQQLDPYDTKIILTGILPTLKKSDLGWHNLTPRERYKALMQALSMIRGEDYELRLEGIDELRMKHDSPLLEACNTSFQVHLQVSPDDFVDYYNIAQTIAAPTIAMAANSPLLFGKRLWHETRIALFQQSIDSRISEHHIRDRSPRVTFGSGWLRDSILDIYKEDIVRHRVLLSSDHQVDAYAEVLAGRIPKLHALQVHNSTVYRWNRPCYGISDNGKPHLRIENRVLPAGPTVIDEMANAAFWLGMMKGLKLHYGDITSRLGFEDVSDNFLKAARTGIDNKFSWTDDRKFAAADLVLNELLPLAREGLQAQRVQQEDIDRYLGVIEGRARNLMTGARWILRTYTKLAKEAGKDEALSTLTAVIVENQSTTQPVHEWKMPTLEDLKEYKTNKLVVEEIMETDIFSVRRDDIVEFVANLMNWRKMRYVVVEDEKGKLEGIISSSNLIQYYSDKLLYKDNSAITVGDIMVNNPITVHSHTPITEAIQIMEQNEIGCLPVVNNGGILIGILTEMNFLRISHRLLKRLDTQP